MKPQLRQKKSQVALSVPGPFPVASRIEQVYTRKQKRENEKQQKGKETDVMMVIEFRILQKKKKKKQTAIR